MRATTMCPACKHRVIWRIDPVRDRDLSSELMAVWYTATGDGVGHFELYVCASCGATEWWAAGFEGQPAPGDPEAKLTSDEQRECVSCREKIAWIVPMLDRITGGDPTPMAVVTGHSVGRGRLLARICAGCGRTDWRARGLDSVVESTDVKPSPKPCSCGSVATYTAPGQDATLLERRRGFPSSLRWERRGIAQHTGFWGLSWRGKLDLHLCSACGRVDWIGRGLDQLRDDPAAGVVRLDGSVRSSGPYR